MMAQELTFEVDFAYNMIGSSDEFEGAINEALASLASPEYNSSSHWVEINDSTGAVTAGLLSDTGNPLVFIAPTASGVQFHDYTLYMENSHNDVDPMMLDDNVIRLNGISDLMQAIELMGAIEIVDDFFAASSSDGLSLYPLLGELGETYGLSKIDIWGQTEPGEIAEPDYVKSFSIVSTEADTQLTVSDNTTDVIFTLNYDVTAFDTILSNALEGSSLLDMLNNEDYDAVVLPFLTTVSEAADQFIFETGSIDMTVVSTMMSDTPTSVLSVQITGVDEFLKFSEQNLNNVVGDILSVGDTNESDENLTFGQLDDFVQIAITNETVMENAQYVLDEVLLYLPLQDELLTFSDNP